MLMNASSVFPQMNLSNKITKLIDGAMDSFIRDVSARYNIGEEELCEAWKKAAGTATTKKTGTRRQARQSGYQVFAKTARPLIREADPSMSFGDISKEVSRRWRALEGAEREEYNRMAVHPTTAPPTPADDTMLSDDESDTGSVAGGGYSPVLLDDDEETMPPTAPPAPVHDTMLSDDESDTGSVAGGGYSPVLLDDDDDEETMPPTAPPSPRARPIVSFASMTIRALREECKKNGLSPKGKSAELVARLTAHARP
jgi:hypothetical protein